jgi:phosphate transport system substrate-binding protein
VTKRLRSAGLIGAALALTLAAAACGGSGDPGPGGSGDALSGEVNLDGSSTVGPFAEAAAEAFEEAEPGVAVNVAQSGTGGGFEKFCQGETDISNASRPIKDDEAALCEQNGIAFEQITVANDALTVLVNPDNPIDCLTVEQLRAIWAPDSTITNWNQIPDLDVDFDQPLDLYGPGTDSGTFDFFTAAINGEEGAQRTDYNNIGENDNTGLTGVQSSVGGMFYVGYTYYAVNQNSVKALQIDSGDGCVAPSPQTATDGSYAPLSRGLYMYPSDAALAKPQVLAFVQFVINENELIAEAADAIALTAQQKAQMLTAIDALAA